MSGCHAWLGMSAFDNKTQVTGALIASCYLTFSMPPVVTKLGSLSASQGSMNICVTFAGKMNSYRQGIPLKDLLFTED